MKACCKCGEGVSSGLIICSECHNNGDAPLMFYIDRLAEDIEFNYPSVKCELCINRSCEQQESGLVRQNGTKAFLLLKIKEYVEKIPA